MKILGISRSHRFSPNSTGRDEAIFMAVASRLNRRHDVSIISEDLFVAVDLEEFDLVFSMARGTDVLQALAKEESENGLTVVNSASALLNDSRCQLYQTLKSAAVPQPASAVVDTASPQAAKAAGQLGFPLWLKRGDACAQSASDVCFVENEKQLADNLALFASKGIESALAVSHAEGDLVKFYGVEGTDFFTYSYPTAGEGFSKFGLEQHNGEAHRFPFDEAELHQLATRAAQASGMTVYGGDAVISSDGHIALIDFNDWPSFSSCRKEAATHIAARIEKETEGIAVHKRHGAASTKD